LTKLQIPQVGQACIDLGHRPGWGNPGAGFSREVHPCPSRAGSELEKRGQIVGSPVGRSVGTAVAGGGPVE
jgi:hypothetical protein